MVLEILKIGAAVAVGFVMLLYFFQERMLFYPHPPARAVAPPARAVAEEIALTAPDGVRLSGWFVRTGPQSAPLLIYFGGNAEDVSWLIGLADRFAGYSLMLLNYRGYGSSEGRPGEAAFFSDALLAYDYASRRSDVDHRRIVAMGRSLGSGVAVHLAGLRPLAGLILVTPYDSVLALAQAHYPFLPVRLMLRHPFDSLSRAGATATPLVCIVAEHDRVIPRIHSSRLFDAWGAPDKRWVDVAGADHDSIAGEPVYWAVIAAFLERFSGGRGTPDGP